VPTNGGLVNPAAAVGEITRKHNVPYLLDACQAVGQMPVDVRELGCDYLTATGRKFLRGPRGTGFLYIRKELIEETEPAMIDHFAAPWVAKDRYQLRPDARRFENWENAYALRAGLGAAVEYALELGLETIRDRAWGLANLLRAELLQIKGATLCDAGSKNCAIVSFPLMGWTRRIPLPNCDQRGFASARQNPPAPDSTPRIAGWQPSCGPPRIIITPKRISAIW
jgi:selenocysteine lyase/cysteine desulfurase